MLTNRGERGLERLEVACDPRIILCRKRCLDVAFGLVPLCQRLFGEADLRARSRCGVGLVRAFELDESLSVAVLSPEPQARFDQRLADEVGRGQAGYQQRSE